MNHTGDTFVTPVFNGSASLRDAAGQMIENVTKSIRRKQTVDEAYMQTLYADVTSLYRLDQISGASMTTGDLGPLPKASVALLCCLGGTWVIMGSYLVFTRLKSKKISKKH